jgi:RNA polymerase sigma-70 factor (ECF subfamily)
VTEAELIERCREGDREAQHELYARTSQRIYRLLERMTGSADAAFDLAQDTYLRAFTRISQFDGRSAIATWLYRIAVTEALQFLRRAKRMGAPLAAEAADLVQPNRHNGIVQLDVRDALAALDPGDRAVLLLRYQEGLDYRAIAQALDCAEGTVGSRLSRARDRIREMLGKDYAPAEEVRRPAHPKGRTRGELASG